MCRTLGVGRPQCAKFKSFAYTFKGAQHFLLLDSTTELVLHTEKLSIIFLYQ